MDPTTKNQLRAMIAATGRPNLVRSPDFRRSRRFWVELDRRGLFLRLGRTEAYLCSEPEGAWYCRREPDGLDAQAWRLHLVIGRVPA